MCLACLRLTTPIVFLCVATIPRSAQVNWVKGDATDAKTVERVLEDADAAVHAIGMFPPLVVRNVHPRPPSTIQCPVISISFSHFPAVSNLVRPPL